MRPATRPARGLRAGRRSQIRGETRDICAVMGSERATGTRGPGKTARGLQRPEAAEPGEPRPPRQQDSRLSPRTHPPRAGAAEPVRSRQGGPEVQESRPEGQTGAGAERGGSRSRRTGAARSARCELAVCSEQRHGLAAPQGARPFG